MTVDLQKYVSPVKKKFTQSTFITHKPKVGRYEKVKNKNIKNTK